MAQFVGGRSLFSRIDRLLYRFFRGAFYRSESDPISPNEWLLRRVPNKWYDSSLEAPFERLAFRPNQLDDDGISLFREMFVSPKDISISGRKPPYTVARIRASSIKGLGLEITATPDPSQPPGHVSLPDLSLSERNNDSKKSKEFQFGLSRSAKIACDPMLRRNASSKPRINKTFSLVFA